MVMTEEVRVVLQKKLPPTLKDLGLFTVLCSIRSIESKALRDLVASVNLMSFFVLKKLSFGEVKPTIVTLQLAN